ncbi:YcaO-related McrA-glycine thioamidation protein [Methanococcus aeolicus]|uniref:YcaO-related McrA-glycine thioamidation protein n=1 Tax=Methanococcus aeolicus TaxID=42879 RepID=UPI0021CA8930|nr:YcaO-related McrA-glycine thioamidation protein [Methanococcus aeolicus]UXM84425.1 YcaO-related McrA-glycine thioamidation protein [Methanococcus aeolicus]
MYNSINYIVETYRVCSPEETWKKIKSLTKNINIEILERIDNLDRIGIPVYSAKRIVKSPENENENDTKEKIVKYHYGKGATDIQAKVSAVMEAIERYSMCCLNEPATKNPENPIDLKELVLSKESYKNINQINNNINNIEWTTCHDIINDEIIDIPVNAVCHPIEGKLFKSNTNGIASGNTKDEAIFHGTLELIERDSWSIAEIYNKTHTKINIDGAKNPIIHELMDKFKDANINVVLKDLTSDIGIPTVAAVSDEPVLKDPALLCIGVGCHINPEIAVIRALTEVIQSRATQIQNKRDDTIRGDIVRKVQYDRLIKVHRKWYRHKDEINIEELPNNAKLNLKKDLNVIKNKLIDTGFDKLIVADLKKPEVGIDVVRIIIPKIEVYCMDRDRISPWIRERMKNIKN